MERTLTILTDVRHYNPHTVLWALPLSRSQLPDYRAQSESFCSSHRTTDQVLLEHHTGVPSEEFQNPALFLTRRSSLIRWPFSTSLSITMRIIGLSTKYKETEEKNWKMKKNGFEKFGNIANTQRVKRSTGSSILKRTEALSAIFHAHH